MSEAIKQPAGPEGIIQMQGVNKWYGQFHVLKDINLNVRQGERIVLCGPSGSGKSTTIRCLNRLEEHQQGRIVVDGVELTNDLKQIEAIRREVGMVFQHFNLFPHLSILENCTLAPMWVRKMPRRKAEEIAMHYLERVRIPEQAHKYPGQLSGGQRQRVAIARALVMNPEIVICDEPTSALDVSVQAQIMNLLMDLRREFNLTYVFISHNLAVVEHIATDVAVMYLGRVVESAPTAKLFHDPRHPYTQALLASVLTPEPGLGIPDMGLGLSFPDPLHPPPGCPFHPRCQYAMAQCKTERPALTLRDTSVVACHLYPAASSSVAASNASSPPSSIPTSTGARPS